MLKALPIDILTKLLNQILISEAYLHIFSSEKQLAEFMVRILLTFPGVDRCGMCTMDSAGLIGNLDGVDCPRCRARVGNSGNFEEIKCVLSQMQDMLVFPLETSSRRYGHIVLATKKPGIIDVYKPFLLNFINAVTIAIENRWQKKELEKTNTALADSLVLFQTLAANSPVGIFRTDATGAVVYFNDRWHEISGMNHETSQGDGWLAAVHPEDRERVVKEWREAVDTHGKYRSEHRYVRPGGEIISVLAQADREKETGLDHLPGLVGTVTDITELKQAEAELDKSRARMMHMDKLTSLGKLTGSVAHEFNNPIYGVLNILEQTLGDVPASQEYKNLWALAIKECNRMSDLIRKLQGFYQPTHCVAHPLDIHQVMDEVLLLIKKKLQDGKIKLETDYDRKLPPISLVEDQIKQVFLNLLTNAEEAIHGEGGEIAISTRSQPPYASVSIRDNGEGIPPQNIEHLFEPFFTTRAVKGTGLGLSVSHGIIEAHGGNIEVHSEPGKGSVFTVFLPLTGVDS